MYRIDDSASFVRRQRDDEGTIVDGDRVGGRYFAVFLGARAAAREKKSWQLALGPASVMEVGR
ncbi:MAG: hypothetical protein ACPG77_09825 [Nannocystaceae bacterium]